MSVLKDVLTAYRAALVADTSYVNIPENMTMEQLPETNLDRVFEIRVSRGPLRRNVQGGTITEYEAEIEVEKAWLVNTDAEFVHDRIADDLVDEGGVMHKNANRPAGCQLIDNVNPGAVVLSDDGGHWMNIASYSVIFRETQDLT